METKRTLAECINNGQIKKNYFSILGREDLVYQVVGRDEGFGNGIKSIDMKFVNPNGPRIQRIYPYGRRSRDLEATKQEIQEAKRIPFKAKLTYHPVQS